jgi:hypothetical protein
LSAIEIDTQTSCHIVGEVVVVAPMHDPAPRSQYRRGFLFYLA